MRELTDSQWDGVSPLIELQPIDAAPDGAALRAALPTYINKIALEINKSVPEDREIFIDTHLVSTGYARPANLLVVVCDLLRKKINRAIYPVADAAVVASLGALTPQLMKSFLEPTATVLLRLRSDQIEPSQEKSLINALTAIGFKKRNIHLLIDQYSLVSQQPAACATSIRPYLAEAFATSCASVTLGGGSFPTMLTGIKAGVTNIPRIEWNVWKIILKSAEFPQLRYADYTVTNPEPLPDIDPKKVNPSISIRYAADGHWHLLKGAGFKGAPPGVYRSLCKLLITNHVVYSGEKFSSGDGRYFAAASGPNTNGSPWSWRREATNHHIVFTVDSL